MRPVRYILIPLLLLIVSCGKTPKTEERREAPRQDTAEVEIPRKPDNIHLTLVYPEPGAFKPKVDSNFLFGSTGWSKSTLIINGYTVPVASNGGWLAWLPMPADGIYRIVAFADGESDTLLYRYVPQPDVASQDTSRPKGPVITKYPSPRTGIVIKGSDTLATGSDVAVAAPTLTADRKWFFPKGAKLPVIGKTDANYQLSFSGGIDGYIADTNLSFELATTPIVSRVGTVTSSSTASHVDVKLPVGYAPFLIEEQPSQLRITVYGPSPSANVNVNDDLGLITSAKWSPSTGALARLDLTLGQPVWGYKAFYDAEGALVVRVRRPPIVNPSNPFQGIRIVVDAGHPPVGAKGPTGLTEAEANLAIALRVAEQLRQRGATVIMTRTDEKPMKSWTDQTQELWVRTRFAVEQEGDILLSIHNNAFPDGVNPFVNAGSTSYFFHPHSSELAGALINEIAPVTGLANLGAKARSLALVRLTWMPAVLTESLYMMFPEQEMMLRDGAFLDRLATAHVKGLERFLRGRGL